MNHDKYIKRQVPAIKKYVEDTSNQLITTINTRLILKQTTLGKQYDKYLSHICSKFYILQQVNSCVRRVIVT